MTIKSVKLSSLLSWILISIFILISCKSQLERSLDNLKDNNSEVCRKAAKRLGELGDKRAVEALINALNENFEQVSKRDWRKEGLRNWINNRGVNVKKKGTTILDIGEEIAIALGKIGDERAITPLSNIIIKSKDHYRQHNSAANALVDLGQPGISALVNLLRSGEGDSRYLKDILINAGERVVETVLLQGILYSDENDPSGRYFLLRGINDLTYVLEEILHADARTLLIDSLKDPHFEKRARVVFALGELKEKKAYSHLLGLLNDKHQVVRTEAAVAIMKLNEPNSLDVFKKYISGESPSIIQQTYTFFLNEAQKGDEEFLFIILETHGNKKMAKSFYMMREKYDKRFGAFINRWTNKRGYIFIEFKT